MLKKRIIPVQLLLKGRLVKTVQFASPRDVGDPVASSKVYNDQYADELVFLNINREVRTIEPLIELIEKVSESCFMPLAVGGGISQARDAEKLIAHGADKVVVNSACYRNPALITEIAAKFGTQAVIASIDVRQRGDSFVLFSECGRNSESIDLDEHVRRCIQCGAGEILINSIDHDGKMNGYDLALLARVGRGANVPVIGCGGAGSYQDLLNAFRLPNISALACGSLFNFGDNNPIRAKAFLTNYDLAFKVV